MSYRPSKEGFKHLRLTKEQRTVFSKMGKKGGKKLAAKLTAAERSASARKAVNARWKKHRDIRARQLEQKQ